MRAAALLLLLTAWECGGADVYRISGRVVDAVSGAPRPASRVALVPAGGTAVVARQRTGPDGKFSFEVPSGKYDVQSDDPSDPQRYGSARPDTFFSSSLIAAPAQDNAGLVFRWFPQGAITGKVTDETGEPVVDAFVQLSQSVVQAGRRVTVYVKQCRSDDRGEYRLGLVPGGTYLLQVSGRPWYAPYIPATYPSVWYPNAPDPARAVSLTLAPGEEARADFSLRANRQSGTEGQRNAGARIEAPPQRKPPSLSGAVQLKNRDAQPDGPMVVRLFHEDDGRSTSAMVRPDGSFSFAGMSPGRYRVEAGSADRYFAAEVRVEGAPYRDGVLELADGQSVSMGIVASDETGQVSGYAAKGDRQVEGVLVVLAPAAETGNWRAYRGFQTDHDGSYFFRGVPAGDYLLFAVEDVGLQYANPAAVRPYLPFAKAVRIEAHSSGVERIPVAGRPK